MRQESYLQFYAKRDTLSDDFGLIIDAFAEAFRAASSPSRLESRWSKLRHCGESF